MTWKGAGETCHPVTRLSNRTMRDVVLTPWSTSRRSRPGALHPPASSCAHDLRRSQRYQRRGELTRGGARSAHVAQVKHTK